jgi:hypothetical protein
MATKTGRHPRIFLIRAIRIFPDAALLHVCFSGEEKEREREKERGTLADPAISVSLPGLQSRMIKSND